MGNIKNSRKRCLVSVSTAGLSVAVLSFIAGLALCFFFSDSLTLAVDALKIRYDIFLAAACAFILFILVQLSAFSVFGIFMIPFADALCGVYSFVMLKSGLPTDFDTLWIGKTFVFFFIFVFAFVLLSVASFRSSQRLLRRMHADREFRINTARLLLMIIALVLLLIFGLTDF